MGFFDFFSSNPATPSPTPVVVPPPAACPMSGKSTSSKDLNPQGLKPCCACPETKSARDDCFLKHDSTVAPEACKELVMKHLACMKGYGFNV